MQVNAFSKTAERSSAMDISPPPFRLLDVFDDVGNIIEDPRKRRRVGLLCDGKTIYDDPSCLASQTEVSTLFAIKFPYFFIFCVMHHPSHHSDISIIYLFLSSGSTCSPPSCR
jgi:hypothetical protein